MALVILVVAFVYVALSTDLLEFTGARDTFKYATGTYIDVYSTSRFADIETNFRLAVTHPRNDVYLNMRDKIYKMQQSADACKPNESMFAPVGPAPADSAARTALCAAINPDQIAGSASVYHVRLRHGRDFGFVSHPVNVLLETGYFTAGRKKLKQS